MDEATLTAMTSLGAGFALSLFFLVHYRRDLVPGSWLAIREHLRPGDTFVDVGAHTGHYSLKAARAVGPNGCVIAIEPNARAVRELQDNIWVAGAEAIIVEPVACSDGEGWLELGAAVESYRVRARPLDAIIRESGVSRVDVIKIDVEGAELLVLKGARATLTRYHPLLIVEVVEHQLGAMGTSSVEITKFLRSFGYEPRHRIGESMEFACRNSSSVVQVAQLPVR